MDKKELLHRVKEDFRRCEPIFLALGERVRQEIVLLLIDAECDGLNVSTITQNTHLSRPAVSHHLKILKEAGIVQVRCQGTMNYYYMSPETGLGELCAVSCNTRLLIDTLKTAKYEAQNH